MNFPYGLIYFHIHLEVNKVRQKILNLFWIFVLVQFKLKFKKVINSDRNRMRKEMVLDVSSFLGIKSLQNMQIEMHSSHTGELSFGFHLETRSGHYSC